MHVAIYTPHWKKGGIERVAKYLVEGLSGKSEEYRFSIITEDVPNPSGQYAMSKDVALYFRSFSPFDEARQKRLRELFLRIDPDVVIVMASNRTLYKPPRALVGLPIPIIISEHNSGSEILKNFYGDRRFLNAVRNMADFNHVLFETYASDYPDQSKVRAINNPVLPATAVADVSSNSSSRHKILNISRYDLGQKQQDILIKSFAKIASKYPDWDVEMHGGDWFGGQKKLKDLVTSLAMQDRIYLHDATDNVGEVLAAGKIFAFPSAFEGSPLVVGEALAHGLPVVGFRQCEGVRLVLEDGFNGLLVNSDVRDVDAFAKGLEELIRNEELRISMSRNAVKSVAHRGMKQFIEAWERLILEAVEVKGRNVLFNCSGMERDYIDLIGSGLLFDQIAKGRKAERNMARIENFFKRYKLSNVADAVFRRM